MSKTYDLPEGRITLFASPALWEGETVIDTNQPEELTLTVPVHDGTVCVTTYQWVRVGEYFDDHAIFHNEDGLLSIMDDGIKYLPDEFKGRPVKDWLFSDMNVTVVS